MHAVSIKGVTCTKSSANVKRRGFVSAGTNVMVAKWRKYLSKIIVIISYHITIFLQKIALVVCNYTPYCIFAVCKRKRRKPQFSRILCYKVLRFEVLIEVKATVESQYNRPESVQNTVY